MTTDATISLKQEIESLLSDAEAFFDRIIRRDHRKDADERRSGNFSLTKPTDVQESERLQSRLVAIGNKLIPIIRTSPMLTAADERSAMIAFRMMRGALMFENHMMNKDGDWEVFYTLSDETSLHTFRGGYQHIMSLIPMMAPDALHPAAVTQRPEVRQYRRNTAFIMMQIDPKVGRLEDVKNGVKEVFGDFGIEARRSDEIEHSDSITLRILDEIENSEFLFADLSSERPSVYYEVGYAHALGKRVIMFREAGTKLHFDLTVHNVKEYNSVTELKGELRKRLEAMTGKRSSSGNKSKKH